MVVRTTWKPSWTWKNADGDSMQAEEFSLLGSGLGGRGLKPLGQDSEPHRVSWEALLASKERRSGPESWTEGPSGQ